MKRWRWLGYEVQDAATNMAVDEAILESVLQGAPPTLRFYGWAPPAVSIGYAQRLSRDCLQRAEELGYEVVRRPTGGRAVLHLGELTYSFVGTAFGTTVMPGGDASQESDAFLSQSVISAYKQICDGLILGLRHLNVETQLGQANAGYREMNDCFLATTSADLHYQGKKLVGSAQLRRRTAVLQHGSILLNQKQEAMSYLLTGERLADAAAPQRHANLFHILGKEVPLAELEAVFKRGFEETFQVSLEEGELTSCEISLVNTLRSKYQLQTGVS